MESSAPPPRSGISRRTFVKTSVAAAGATWLGQGPARGNTPDRLRVGLIGCGGRGRHDTTTYLQAADQVELVAMADLFPEQLNGCLRAFTNSEPLAGRIKVTPDRCFTGLDCHDQLLALDDVDVVILTEPPGFRPDHFTAAVNAGKHVFMEKPVATDPIGFGKIIEAGEIARGKGLSVVAGTQARRMPARNEVIRRIQDGAIGEIVAGQCYRCGGAMRDWRANTRDVDLHTLEGQIQRWLFVNWVGGDFITEMHIHELDVCNWAMGGPPTECFGVGGRQQRVEPEFGNIFDHFAVDYVYPNGARLSYIGTQIDGVSGPGTGERIVGTKGVAYTSWGDSYIEGENPYRYDGEAPNPEVRQFQEHIASIRNGEPLNEARRVAESSLTSIMGRMSAYTGRRVSWNWLVNASTRDLAPASLAFGSLPLRPPAIPARNELGTLT